MEQPKSVAPDFARQNPAPKEVQDMHGSKGTTDPATDGGGNRGNSAAELHRKIVGK